MEISKISYLGELRTEARHLKSGETFITDAPLDNQGKGAAFSPTDLLATSLGACMVTIMGIAARTHGIPIGKIEISVSKFMASNPRRIEKIGLILEIEDRGYTDHQKNLLETAGRNCPVAKSLHPDLVQEVQFIYQ